MTWQVTWLRCYSGVEGIISHSCEPLTHAEAIWLLAVLQNGENTQKNFAIYLISVVRVGNPCAWELSQPNKYLALHNFPKFENTGFHGQLMQDSAMATIWGEDSQHKLAEFQHSATLPVSEWNLPLWTQKSKQKMKLKTLKITFSWLMLISVLQYSQVTLLNWQFCWCDSSWLYGSTTSHPLWGQLTVWYLHTSTWFYMH